MKDPAWLSSFIASAKPSSTALQDIDFPDHSSLNVQLLVGLVSGFGTLFLSLLIGILWFTVMGRRSISLGSLGAPGDFDDDQALLEAEAEYLDNMDEVSRQNYNLAKAFIAANPPNSATADISLSQFLTIQEKGVSAWEFEVDFPNANCFIEGRTEIEFFDSTCSSQTNLPVPRQNEVYYWEAKMYEKPESTLVSVGLSTKPYPAFRLPGYHRYSVAYDSLGTKRMNQPFYAPPGYGPEFKQGDVIGVGYRPRTGTVFFTRNGKKLEDALHGMRLNLFPTVGATGPCKVAINFGQAGFVFIEANVKKWGLAPAHGSLAPPPPYGAEQDFVLLETGSSSSHQALQQQTPPPPHPLASLPQQLQHPYAKPQNVPSGTPPPAFDRSRQPPSTSTTTAASRQSHPDSGVHIDTETQPLLCSQSPPPSYKSQAESVRSRTETVEHDNDDEDDNGSGYEEFEGDDEPLIRTAQRCNAAASRQSSDNTVVEHDHEHEHEQENVGGDSDTETPTITSRDVDAEE